MASLRRCRNAGARSREFRQQCLVSGKQGVRFALPISVFLLRGTSLQVALLLPTPGFLDIRVPCQRRKCLHDGHGGRERIVEHGDAVVSHAVAPANALLVNEQTISSDNAAAVRTVRWVGEERTVGERDRGLEKHQGSKESRNERLPAPFQHAATPLIVSVKLSCHGSIERTGRQGVPQSVPRSAQATPPKVAILVTEKGDATKNARRNSGRLKIIIDESTANAATAWAPQTSRTVGHSRSTLGRCCPGRRR